jgi:predicted RNase H-like nuclease (RuvC/YqgF family)
LRKISEMNSVDTFHKRLRDEITAVKEEIQSHNQQVESLTQRLEGLKRADKLFDSDQAAIAELLQTGIADGSGTRETATAPAAKVKKAPPRPKASAAHKQLGRTTQVSRVQMKTGRDVRTASQNSGLTRLDMIAAVLRRHPRRSVRELIALLNKEYRWKANESAVTKNLYTRRDKFVHIPADRSTNRPVTWSLK